MLGKVPVNVRVEGEIARQIDEIYDEGLTHHKNKSDFLRDALEEGIGQIKKRVEHGKTGKSRC